MLNSQAAEFSAHGIVDFRISHIDSLEKSYLDGGQGKFALGDELHFSLAQAGADLLVTWDNGFSAHGVVNAYLDGTDSGKGGDS